MDGLMLVAAIMPVPTQKGYVFTSLLTAIQFLP